MKNLPIISYNGNIEEITENKKTPHYFAAANSKDGFVSYFKNVFGGDDIKRLYILLGGPGSGKSTMMKRVADISEKEGNTTERIHCSSSPYSLDGVIIKEKGIAVIDGTNPHTYDASYPGVRETVIDPGIAWDTKKLYEKKGEIFELTSRKKSSYRKAYLYLRAAGLISDEMKEVAKSCVLTEKLLKNAEVQIRGALHGKGTQFSESIRLQRGITGQGSVYFESLARSAEKRILVKDVHGISEIYFSYLYKEAKRNGLNGTVSYSPEDRSVIDGILFEDASVCFSLYCNENECDKIINCERFEDKSAFSDVKQKYAFAARCKNALEAQAYSALSDAAKYHEEIEKVYAPCTDYSITERLTDELCEMIFT